MSKNKRGLRGELELRARRFSNFLGQATLKSRMIDRRRIFDLMLNSLESGTGFGLAKVGDLETDALFRARALGDYHSSLPILCNWAGVFPAESENFRRWTQVYLAATKELDVIAVTRPAIPALVMANMEWKHGELTWMMHSEPARMHPLRLQDDDRYCYTRLFKERRLLLVNPIASYLKSRATQEVISSCWGLDWWFPASVEALDIPNAVDADVRRRFGNYHVLLEHILELVQERVSCVDVVLIGAGSYGVPIAAELARQGKVALGIGGHLQTMFGVYGHRWEVLADWRDFISNSNWTRPPENLRPSDFAEQENGCYW